jgi:antitoxin (DNA-binding transcriptional repressor) of toxin-antitoxin stability system
MTRVTIEEAQSRLPQLIAETAAGEEVLITRGDKPVAQLLRFPGAKPRPVLGGCKGRLVVIAEDDDHLADFAGYMK